MILRRVADGRTWSPDAWETASFSPRIQVTDHPIEDGSEVSDHAQSLPLTFTVRAWVSQTPNDTPNPLAIEQAVRFFEESVGKLLTVTLPGEGQFANCLLTAYPHTRKLQGGRPFELSFKQVVIAQAINVAIPARLPVPDAADSAADSTDAGKQPTETMDTPEPPEAAPDKSSAAAFFDFLRGGG